MIHRAKNIAGLFFILVLVIPLQGQDEKRETKKWTGNVSLGLSLNTGNSETSNVSFAFVANHRFSRKVEWDNSGIFLFGKARQITVKETYRLDTSIKLHHSERILTYYSLQGGRDIFKNFDHRFLPGLGVGYKVLSADKIKLIFTSGPSLVVTEYHDSSDRTSYAGLSLSDQFTWDITEYAQFNQKWTLNFNLQDFSHTLWLFEANLISTLFKSWAIKLTFINSYDSKPVGDRIKKDDYTFLAGISKKF